MQPDVRHARAVDEAVEPGGEDVGVQRPAFFVDQEQAVVTDYLYDGQGLPVEQVTTTGTNYYNHDQYGPTRVLTDSTGAVTATFSYTPYGALTGKTGTADTPLRWNGQLERVGDSPIKHNLPS